MGTIRIVSLRITKLVRTKLTRMFKAMMLLALVCVSGTQATMQLTMQALQRTTTGDSFTPPPNNDAPAPTARPIRAPLARGALALTEYIDAGNPNGPNEVCCGTPNCGRILEEVDMRNPHLQCSECGARYGDNNTTIVTRYIDING